MIELPRYVAELTGWIHSVQLMTERNVFRAVMGAMLREAGVLKPLALSTNCLDRWIQALRITTPANVDERVESWESLAKYGEVIDVDKPEPEPQRKVIAEWSCHAKSARHKRQALGRVVIVLDSGDEHLSLPAGVTKQRAVGATLDRAAVLQLVDAACSADLPF